MSNDAPRKTPLDDKRHSLAGNTRVQDEFLKRMLERKSGVLIRLVDGTVVRGTLTEFDQYSLLILPDPPGPLMLIYKHGVASVSLEVEAKAKQAA